MASKKTVKIGNLTIGGGHPVAVQSMLNKEAHDVAGCTAQAKELEEAGCEIIRATVPDAEAVKTIAALKEAVSVPIVADIHFDYRMALESLAAGVDKIRINPGNIGDDGRVKAVADACRQRGVPIRIGVNSGSVEKEILAKYGAPTPEALVESALYHVRLLEKHDFDDIVISIKSSDVPTTVAAYRLMREKCGYPLHLGVTEAGTERMGLIKSAAGIGSLLMYCVLMFVFMLAALSFVEAVHWICGQANEMKVMIYTFAGIIAAGLLIWLLMHVHILPSFAQLWKLLPESAGGKLALYAVLHLIAAGICAAFCAGTVKKVAPREL